MLSDPQLCSAALKANQAKLVIWIEGASSGRKDGKFVFSVTNHWVTYSPLQAQVRFPGFLVTFSPAMGEISSPGWNCIRRGGEGAAPRGDAADVGAPAVLTPRYCFGRGKNLRHLSSPTSPWSALITAHSCLESEKTTAVQVSPENQGI